MHFRAKLSTRVLIKKPPALLLFDGVQRSADGETLAHLHVYRAPVTPPSFWPDDELVSQRLQSDSDITILLEREEFDIKRLDPV